MNEEQFKLKVSRFITEQKGGVGAYARELGVSDAFVSAMKTGKKRPTKAVLDDMGYERITDYRVKYQKVGS